jgi:hypothetical protein
VATLGNGNEPVKTYLSYRQLSAQLYCQTLIVEVLVEFSYTTIFDMAKINSLIVPKSRCIINGVGVNQSLGASPW